MDFTPVPYKQYLAARNYTIWQLLKLYWQSDQRVSAYLFFVSISLLTILLVGFSVTFNYWYNYFYNALQAYDRTSAFRLLVLFFVIAAFAIIVAVYRYYISQLFGLRWRRWLTEQFIDRWLKKRGYYYLENFEEKTDNPDQRIQEDINALVSNSINLSMGLLSSITTFFAFIYVLWTLSGILIIPLGHYGSLHIPGYLVWVGLIYAYIGTYFTFKLGRPLVPLNFEQQKREANFRYAGVDVRNHSEHIALYRGEEHQKSILDRIFSGVLQNWYFIVLRQKILLWFTAGYSQAAVVLPLLVALPNYFDKIFLLGGLMQSISAFDRVQDALSFLVNSFTQIAEWKATCQRLTTFVNHLNEVEHNVEKHHLLKTAEHDEDSIITKKLTILTPREEILLANINEKLIAHRHYLIKGESGIGKSTLVRTLAGIWPYASGEVIYPKNKNIMYLSQRLYMPIGTLAECILYPDKTYGFNHLEIEKVLHLCHLDEFIPRLDEAAAWRDLLSPGEQQRIAFARILIHKPDWVFLDESTSMLDLANEEYLYTLIKNNLPNITIVSVGHRPSLDGFHDVIIDIAKYIPCTKAS